jgi:hypothetical protein
MSDEWDQQQQRPPRLSADLISLYAPRVDVPARVDDAVLNRARAALLRNRRRRQALRWGGVAAAAAAAIAITVVVLRHDVAPTHTPVALHPTSHTEPRVTIIDVLKLARQIERGSGSDVNRDGHIDRSDVDALALAAVKLDETVGGVQ